MGRRDSTDAVADYVAVADLRKWYGDREVLRGVSVSINKGETLVLLGPSGCGKTTTMQIIAGLTQRDSGRVVVGGSDISDMPANRRNIGVVFQNYALFPHLSVFENVAFGLRVRKIDAEEARRKVRAALDLVKLTGVESRLPRQLSGGQQQRVALARALVIQPRLLLLDEPLSNLDRALREEMRGELKRIKAEAGVTTIFVTHDRTEAMDLGDQVAVMLDGVLQQVGSPEEVYEAPSSPFVAGFLGETNFINARLGEGAAPFAEAAGLRLPLARRRVPRDAVAGQSVVLGIRPEAIHLGPSERNGDVRVLFQATGSSYLGNVLELRGRILPHGLPLLIRGISPVQWREATRGAEADRAPVGWAAEDTMVFSG